MARRGIEAWEGPLLGGREAALKAARHAVKVAASVRTHHAYGWRCVSAGRLSEAAKLRRAVSAGRLGVKVLTEVPEDFPVRPLAPGDPAKDRVTCGTCGRSWDDAVSTAWTPAPSARCPFEYFHVKRYDDGHEFARGQIETSD